MTVRLTNRRQRGTTSRRRGQWAESLAVAYLRLKGYRVLERNWRSKLGEIDILVRKGQVLALVEVKTRGDAALARGAVMGPQQRRLCPRARPLSQDPSGTGGFGSPLRCRCFCQIGLAGPLNGCLAAGRLLRRFLTECRFLTQTSQGLSAIR